MSIENTDESKAFNANIELSDTEDIEPNEQTDILESNTKWLQSWRNEKKLTDEDIERTIEERGHLRPFHTIACRIGDYRHGPKFIDWFIDLFVTDQNHAKQFIIDNLPEESQGDSFWHTVKDTLESDKSRNYKVNDIGSMFHDIKLGRGDFHLFCFKYRRPDGSVYEDDVYQQEDVRACDDRWVEEMIILNYYQREKNRRPNEDLQKKKIEIGINSYETFEKFFSQHYRKDDDGIIASYGYHWSHSNSGLFFITEILQNQPTRELLSTINKIDLNNPKVSMIRLAEMKVAKGLKLAEIAGYSYARLVAFLGGEGDYWVNEHRGHVPPSPIDNCQTEDEKIDLLDAYTAGGNNDYIDLIDSDPMDPKRAGKDRSLCRSDNYDRVFHDNDYNIFMAVNFGAMLQGEAHQIDIVRDKIMKKDDNLKHRYFNTDQQGSYWV